MRRQRNTAQMTAQTRNTEVQINKEEMGKLPGKEFRIIVIKMSKNPKNKTEKMQGSINKYLEELKNKHTEINNTITEIKNTLEGLNSRISEAEEQISELEDKMVEITSEKQSKVKGMKRAEDREICNHIKCIKFRIRGVPEEEKKKRYEKIFEEIIVENFPNMEKEIVNQVQEHKESHTG